MRVAFLGPPGAGKGTQARELAREWGVPHMATGDMLREAVAARTAVGLEAKRYMDAGALVPDDVIIGLMRERLAQPDATSGFLLDGFPRTIAQADSLERLLKDLSGRLDALIYFDVTNAFTYLNVVQSVCAELNAMRLRGVKTHAGSSPLKVHDRCC